MMKLKILSVLFVLLGFVSAAEAQEPAELRKVFDTALAAVGGQTEVSKIKSIVASAVCTGPNGKYTTGLTSFRTTKTHFKQTYTYKKEVKNIFINGDLAWNHDAADESFEIISPFQRLVIRLHEYQKIAVDFETMFTDFKLAGEETFNQRPSRKVIAKNDLGGAIHLFFDKQTGLMAGYVLPVPGSGESVINVFNEWKTVGGVKLPSVVTATDRTGDWVFRFDRISINQADEATVNIPRQVTDLAELLRLHKEHQTAHLTYNAELFTRSFAENLTQLQSGNVRILTKQESLERFKSYFSSFKFLEWEDIKPPVIKISKDGTLATVIVEKRVRGTYRNEKGEEMPDHTVFAWLEVWEKIGGSWKIVTVASTSRNGEETR